MQWSSKRAFRNAAVPAAGMAICLALAAGGYALDKQDKPQGADPISLKLVEERTATLQHQVSSLAEDVVAHLGEEPLGVKEVKAIIEVLALQRAVEVFSNLVANHNRAFQRDMLEQSLPYVEESLRRAEEALAEAPSMLLRGVTELPSASNPVSIRSTFEELKASLGLPRVTALSRPEVPEAEAVLEYTGPEPTESELQGVQFNLQRLGEAIELMGHGKCYRDFWTRNCADALEYHALAHQKRSFVKLLVSTRDLLRKYCESPTLSTHRKEYEDLVQRLSVRPIVYDYGLHTTPFVDRPELFRLRCTSKG